MSRKLTHQAPKSNAAVGCARVNRPAPNAGAIERPAPKHRASHHNITTFRPRDVHTLHIKRQYEVSTLRSTQLEHSMQTVISRLRNILLITSLMVPVSGCLSPLNPYVVAAAAGVSAAPLVFGDEEIDPDVTGGPFDAPNDDCYAVKRLTYGSVIQGDTSDVNQGTTSLLDGYPVTVGNYISAELTYIFAATHSGEVTFSLIDPTPTQVNHDLFVLDSRRGCNAEAAIDWGFNSVSFDAEAGVSYYFVVDGFAGDEGAFEAVVQTEDPSASEDDDQECLFGSTSRDLEDADDLHIATVGNYMAAEDVPTLLGQQMLSGVQGQGWAEVANLTDLFEFVDYDGVFENAVRNSSDNTHYNWVKWHVGDTEVGYIYIAGTMEHVATISDGDIYDCSVY